MADLRPELHPPQVDEKLQKQVGNLIEDVADTNKTMSEREKALADLNQLLKPEKPYDFSRFQEYWAAESLEDVVLKITRRIPDVDISHEELKTIMDKISKAENNDFYLDLLKKNFSYPNLSDLIYWPNQLGYDMDLPVEKMVDIIWEYEKKTKSN